MRIISNFKDYYDGAMKYGQDPFIVYERFSKTLDFNDDIYKIEKDYKWRWQKRSFFENFSLEYKSFDSCVIGFCGKFYKMLKTADDKLKYFYNAESVMKYVFSNTRVTSVNEKAIHSFKKQVKQFFAYNLKQTHTDLTNFITTIFQDKNVPCFVVEPENRAKVNLVLNPILWSYDFYKAMNPVQAYQEISMYVGGTLRQPTKNTIEISDRDMAIKKGFGHKYAFKKEPQRR